MGKPLVSVVIPAYNHERFVGAAIESVLGQTCTDFELIIVNDGSTDRTEDVIHSYDDARIKYFFQENQDAYNTINRGISLAQGKYVSILNSDDVYTDERLEKMITLCEDQGIVCAFSRVIPIDDHGKEFTDPSLWWNVWYKSNLDHYFGCKDLYGAFLRGNLMVTTSNLFIASAELARVGNFSPLRYLHDYDYIFRILQLYRDRVRFFHDHKLLYYRIHGGNTLSEAAIIGREQDKELIRKYMLKIIPNEYKEYVKIGSDRLIELEKELHQVKMQLHPSQPKGVRPAIIELRRSFKDWLQRKLGN